jgi:hypothetical protein
LVLVGDSDALKIFRDGVASIKIMRKLNQTMKTNSLRAGPLALAAGGLALVSGCAVDQNGHMALVMPQVVVAPAPVYVAPQPVYVAPAPVYVAPAPVVDVQVAIPDTYVVVEGVNYGFVGGQYYYWGPGNTWVVCDSYHLNVFHNWERINPDWRSHAFRNDRFRTDAHGRTQPLRGDMRGDMHGGDMHGGQPGHGDPRLQPGHGEQGKPLTKPQPKKNLEEQQR